MTTNTVDQGLLREFLVEAFSIEELRSMAFDLTLDHEDLGGDTKNVLARELISALQRRGRLPDLLARIEQLRPGMYLLERAPNPPTSPHGPMLAIATPSSFPCPTCQSPITLVDLSPPNENMTALTNEEYRILDPEFKPNADDTWTITSHIVCRTCEANLNHWQQYFEAYVREGVPCRTCRKTNLMQAELAGPSSPIPGQPFVRHFIFSVKCAFCDTSRVRKVLARSITTIKAIIIGERTTIQRTRSHTR